MKLVDKYRPKTWDDVIGQDNIVYSLKHQDPDSRPNLLFLGKAGTGKTSVATVYAKENNIPIQMMNASDERGINDVRNKIKSIARSKGEKIIFLDEADKLTPDAQDALRATMEIPNSRTIFILSGNYSDKIIDPIKSRCTEFHFNRISDAVIMRKLIEICKKEKYEIKWNNNLKECFKRFVLQCRGDLRKAINNLEAIITERKVFDEKTISGFIKPQITDEVLESAYGGNFQKAREILEDTYINANFDSSAIISDLYESINMKIGNEKHKIRLYIELAKIDRGMNNDKTNDLIQLISFVAFVWLVPHLSDKCPVLKGDNE